MAKLEISIGCKVDKEYEAQLDQAVAVTGKDRANFIREAVRVAMARTIKESETPDGEPEATTPFSFEDAATTIRWLKDNLTDFDQIAHDLQRQSSELQALKRADADAMHRARAEFLEGYPERIMKSQKPVHDKLTELSGKMDDLPGIADILVVVTRIEGQVVAALASMVEAAKEDRKTAAAEAKATRTVIEKTNKRRPALFNFVVSETSWSGTFLATWSLVLATLGALTLFQTASLFPPVAMYMAAHFVDDDRGVCQLIEQRYSRRDCLVPKNRRIELTPPATPTAGKRR